MRLQGSGSLTLYGSVGQARARWLLLALVVAVGLWLRISLNAHQVFSNGDESVYLDDACRVRDAGGIAGYRALTGWYMETPSMWATPRPYRYGYIAAAYLVCRARGAFTLASLSFLSTVASLLLYLTAVAMALRFEGPRLALVTALLLVCDPLVLALGRRALSDMPFAACALLAVWAFLEAHRPQASRGLVFLAVLLLTLQLATSDRGMVVLPALVPWIAASAARTRRVPARVLLMLGAPPLLWWLGFWALTGDPTLLYRMMRETNATQMAAAYNHAFQRGPCYRYLIDEMLLSPLVWLFVPLALAVWVARPLRFSRGARFALSAATALFVLMSAVGTVLGIFFSLRFVLVVEAPLRIGLAAAWVVLTEDARPAVRRGALLLLLANAAVEWAVFQRVFIASAVYDPVTANICRALGMIP